MKHFVFPNILIIVIALVAMLGSAVWKIASASNSDTLTFGMYINTGTLGFEANLVPAKYKLPYAAGYVLRQKWSRIETSDDVFNWSYLDSAINELKNAGKKASIRIGAGPFSPDWLRTQKGVKTVCWFNDTGPNTPEGNTWNCFPWVLDTTYQAQRKELLQALYDHYHNPGLGHRPDLESAISFVSIPPPVNGLSEEFVRVQYPNHTVYLDSNSDPRTHVPIGAYNESSPEQAQIQALTFSTYTKQGYTQDLMKAQHTNSIIDAADVMPTWKIAVMHAKKGPDPLDFVQSHYNTIIDNNLLDRAMMGFTWLMPHDDMVAEEKAIYDDVMDNFYLKNGGMTGWQYDPEDTDVKVEELLAWCTMGAPIHGLWGEAGGGRWPNDLLNQVFQDPYCGLAPTPTPTPTPLSSPSPSSSPTPTSTPTPIVSPSPTPTPIATPTPTPTPSPTPTSTPTTSPSPTPSPTPSPSPTPTPSPTLSPTPSVSPSPIPTPTVSPPELTRRSSFFKYLKSFSLWAKQQFSFLVPRRISR